MAPRKFIVSEVHTLVPVYNSSQWIRPSMGRSSGPRSNSVVKPSASAMPPVTMEIYMTSPCVLIGRIEVHLKQRVNCLTCSRANTRASVSPSSPNARRCSDTNWLSQPAMACVIARLPQMLSVDYRDRPVGCFEIVEQTRIDRNLAGLAVPTSVGLKIRTVSIQITTARAAKVVRHRL
jgi:hypothetical protein